VTAPQPDQQAAVVAEYQQQTGSLRGALEAYIVALWASLGEYRNTQMADWVGQVVPVVEGAMQHMQAVTSAYLATLSGISGGSAVPLDAAKVGISAVRNGADPADVYGRPFHLVWRQLAAQAPLDGQKVADAIKSGQDRAVQLATTDVQLAKTHTAQSQLAKARNVTGYRRQLEGARSCALCIVASTRHYHKAELMPIHPACDCQPVPIYGTYTGTVLDSQQLAEVHGVIAQRFGADSTAARKVAAAVKDNGKPLLYRDVLIEHKHGEIGPILALRGASFTGPNAT
jgi:hypothetical protein